MKKEVTFIVGNGFNWFAYEYMTNHKDEIITAMKKISSLDNSIEFREYYEESLKSLNDYIKLFDKIKIDGLDLEGEILLEEIFTLLFEHNVDDKVILDVENSIKKVIKSKLDSSTIKKKNGTKMYVNATIRNAFWCPNSNGNDLPFTDHLSNIFCNKRDTSMNVITTNYDANVESVFVERTSRKGAIPINTDITFMNIHGDFNKHSQIMVLTSPDKKKDQISPDCFDFLKTSLQNSKTIILFGLGLDSDPHILDELNRTKEANIIIIDSSISKYLVNKNNRYAFLNSNTVFYVDTVNNSIDGDKIRCAADTPIRLLNRLKMIEKQILGSI